MRETTCSLDNRPEALNGKRAGQHSIRREDYLVPLEMSANALAKALNVPTPRINDIVRERRGVSADTALRLARYFDTTAQFWLNLQATFDLRTTEIAAGKRILREVPVMPRAA